MPEFPLTVWRYHLDLAVEGADRQNLPDALEAEDLTIFRDVPREEAYEQIRAGRLRYSVAKEEPAPAFPRDLSVLSLFLFQVVRGIEVAERYVEEGVTDDVRAWKILARKGEWLKVPLLVRGDGEGHFVVDSDREDLDVIRARWPSYPLWFHDGMRRKHPALRDL